MKIISWNFNGAIRKKLEKISAYQAGIYVIQEYKNPLESKDHTYKTGAQNYLWIGDSKNKGLAYLSVTALSQNFAVFLSVNKK